MIQKRTKYWFSPVRASARNRASRISEAPGGIWEKYDPSDFYFQKIVSDTNAREKYWEMSSEFYLTMKKARPNQRIWPSRPWRMRESCRPS
jgi:hypothetical protein